MKRALSVILIVVMMISMITLVTIPASAATSASGTCGENLQWSLENGTLTISGTGSMYDFVADGDNVAPWAVYRNEIDNVVVGEGVTDIGVNAFRNHEMILSVELPSTLTEIRSSAFRYCQKLNTINFPDSLTEIKARAFYDCVALTCVDFSEGSKLCRLGEYVFYHCIALKTVNLPDSVTFIGRNTFHLCVRLTSIHIPAGLTAIPRYFLDNCTDLPEVSIPETVKSIGEYAFSNCRSLTYVKIPDSVKKLDDYAFNYCTNLETMDMLDSVKIEEHTFRGCDKLDPFKLVSQPERSVTVPNVGDTAVLTIEASGKGLKYDWYYRNRDVTEWTKSVCHTATYEVQVTGARYGRQVYCIVTDRYGRYKRSNTSTLYFSNPELKIVSEPDDVHVAKAGDTATVSIGVQGDGLKYTWYYKNQGASDWTESSIHKSSVLVTVTEARCLRQMYCVVKDKFGRTVKSRTITLSFDTGLKITQQPVDTEAAVGENARLKVVAEGKGKTYTWYYKNADGFWRKSTVTKSTYSTAMTEARDGRQVYCVVTDKYGVTVTSDVVTLSVSK